MGFLIITEITMGKGHTCSSSEKYDGVKVGMEKFDGNENKVFYHVFCSKLCLVKFEVPDRTRRYFIQLPVRVLPSIVE